MGYDDYDDEESYYDDDELDELDLPDPETRRNRLIAVFTGSYGISALLHLALLAILALIVIATPPPPNEAVVIAKREKKPQEYDEKLKRDVHKTPKIQSEEVVEKPIIIREQEVEVTSDMPKGTDLSNMSNKNLDSTSVVDAYGVGGGAAGAYGQRWGKGSLSKEGGSEGTESAVTAALRWLKRAQSGNGMWDCDGWTHLEKHPQDGQNAGDGRYDTGVTAMALLAFLGNGHTHRFGSLKRTVNKGLTWLKRQQKSNGSISFDGGETIYNHAIGTMALCEAYAVSRDFTLKRYAEKAINFCIKAQNPNLGWQYGLKTGKNDTSVTGWMVLALKAGKTAGIEVPEEAFSGALRWFKRATAASGDVGYTLPGGGSSFLSANDGKYDPVPCMTGVSVICRIFTGERRSEDAIRKGSKILMDSQPKWSKGGSARKVNFYYWYYGTYAMFQVGGPKWKEWNKNMQSSLLPTQCMGGPEDGSWPPVGEWCLAGGRVYATAINALTLEIYYRYERAQGH